MKTTSQYAVQDYTVTGFHSDIHPAFRQRLLAMGLLPGATFRIIRTAPLGDPVEIETRRTRLALRRKDLQLMTFDAQTSSSARTSTSCLSQTFATGTQPI